jgi:AcrR family transcriptional regulator
MKPEPRLTSRDRIVEVALDHFSRLGFERARLSEIAAQSEVSQPALHYHFTDKRALWEAAMGALRGFVEAEEIALSGAEDLPLDARIKLGLRVFIRMSWKHPALGRIVALEGMAGGERLDWLVTALLGERNRRMVRLFEQAIAAGILPDFPAEQLLVTLQTAAVGVINLRPLMHVNFGVDPEAGDGKRAHEEMIVNGLVEGLFRLQAVEKEPSS